MWFPHEVTLHPPDFLRCSLITVITLTDHLHMTHFRAANVMATAVRKTLSPNHPLRRLLSVFTFGSIFVNLQAPSALQWGRIQESNRDMERHGKVTKTCTFGTKRNAQRINAVEWGRVGKHICKHVKKSSIGGFLHMQHVIYTSPMVLPFHQLFLQAMHTLIGPRHVLHRSTPFVQFEDLSEVVPQNLLPLLLGRGRMGGWG